MEQEELHVVISGGNIWLVKRQNGQFLHRHQQDHGPWRPGIPPDATESFVHLTFNK